MNSKNNFIHLHLHTSYSLLDGACRINQLMDQAKKFQMPSVAITDHGNMFGAIDFYQKALQNDIHPIIGCEVYVAPESRFEKHGHGIKKSNFHLLLLAENTIGYHNLLKLVSAGYMEGFYYKPRIDKELLLEHKEGLIACSACLKGEIPSLILSDKYAQAKDIAAQYKDIFGAEKFFLELQYNGMPEQKEVCESLISMSKELSIPLIATNDCHYLHREHSEAHEVLLCLQTGKTLKDPKRMRLSTDEFYFRSGEEMWNIFGHIPEALSNTLVIADRCNVSIDFDKIHLPDYIVPDNYTLDEYLRILSYRGLAKRYPHLADACKEQVENPHPDSNPIFQRIDRELEIISKMGYPGYFLIVWDFINYAREHSIPVGPGRGSAAGSIVAYSLGITSIDPLAYGLLFERFLNPERVSMPDIDIDFCMNRREEVIDYVTQKYGKENVGQIITFGTMAAKGALRDVGRVLGMSYGDVDKLAKLIPNILNIKLEDAINMEPRLAQSIENDPAIAKLFRISQDLEGLSRHASMHAAGIVITPKPIVNYAPLYRGQNGETVTQFTMTHIEQIGLLKMDFLGLRTLTVIQDTLEMIKENRGTSVNIEEIPTDDELTFKLLQDGKTVGVFQLESSGMRDLLRRLKPESFEDLIALVALYRPGPLGSGMVDDFIKRKQGLVPIDYDHPALQTILKETYGVIVYQEQVMKIASELAGFTLGEADILRRAMGKKKQSVMAEQREKFITGAEARKVDKKIAGKIFDLMAHFAGYGFNKSHSAAYALISYQTAYLKAHYSVEFMAALLNSEKENTDKMVKYIGETKDLSITILPPDVNKSAINFRVLDDQICFGLAAVKNVGENAVRAILNAREKEGNFKSLFDFCRKINLRVANKRVIESLIKCGGFDALQLKRSQLFLNLDKTIELAQEAKKIKQSRQLSLFGPTEEEPRFEAEGPNTTSSIPEWPQQEMLFHEKEAVGFYLTGHPLNRFETELKRWTRYTTLNISSLSDKANVSIGGVLNLIKEIKTQKKGDLMAFADLEDLHGLIEVTLLPDVYRTCQQFIEHDTPVLVLGTIEKNQSDVPKIVATEIIALDDITMRFAKNMHFRIPINTLNEKNIKDLKKLIFQHKGECDIYFHINPTMGEEVLLKADSKFKVKPTENLIKDIETLMGQDTIYFEG
ncbi:MAG: DNA polymerase III subunit alpha [bacterium]